MFFKDINISYFKSIENLKWTCSDGLNLVLGNNGNGKTNLLDALYYMCLTKSFLASSDSVLIHQDADFFRLEANVEVIENKLTIAASFSSHTKKKITIDGEEYDKLSQHIGRFPVVLFAPDDTDLVRGSSELRRKFFDLLICQFDLQYLESLSTYNHILKQRNHYLKLLYIKEKLDITLLAIYDKKLIELNHYISKKRAETILEFQPIFITHYNFISSEKEKANIEYETEVNSDFESIFLKNQEKDIFSQRTNLGIHTDDFEWTLDEKSTKKYASQGQKKSFVLALKLAQFTFLNLKKGIKPILLMDDIFDKLDDFRIKKLLSMLTENVFGQVFITDARAERTKKLLKNIPFNCFTMEDK